MIVRSLLSRITELVRKNAPKDKIILMMKERGYPEDEIRRTIKFVGKTVDYAEEAVDFMDGDDVKQTHITIEAETGSKKGKKRRKKKTQEAKEKKKPKKKQLGKVKNIVYTEEKEKEELVEEEKEEDIKEETEEEPEEEAEEEKPKEEKKEATRVHGKLIETEIDKLYRLVNEKGIIRLSKAAKALKVSGKIVEQWANMLEANDMITIKYHTLGEIELMKKKEEAKK